MKHLKFVIRSPSNVCYIRPLHNFDLIEGLMAYSRSGNIYTVPETGKANPNFTFWDLTVAFE